MKWIMKFLDSGYEVWFRKSYKDPINNKKFVNVRIYTTNLSKAIEMKLERDFINHSDSELIQVYIENVWKEHHKETMI